MERIFLLLLMLSNSSVASSQGSLGHGQINSPSKACFQAGRCTNSSHLKTLPTQDEYECHKSCNADARCEWFTYFPEHGFCQLLSKCRHLSSCPTCLGGPFGCIEPHACTKSQCRGELMDSLPVSNFDECQALCKSTQGCKWLTYNTGSNPLCLLSAHCSNVDETCSRCFTCQLDSLTFGLGSVALILQEGITELYSPEGQCNFKLAKPPIERQNTVLVYLNDQIIACDGLISCWKYNISNDTWLNLNQAPFHPRIQPGVVFENKLYVIDDLKLHIWDFKSNTWSTGPKPPVSFGRSHCLVGWRDSLVFLGGRDTAKGVQIFNVTSQTWTIQSSENVPLEIVWSSALLLGESQVLIVGSAFSSSYHLSAIYDPKTNTWTSLPASQISHYGSRLVKLGSRIFAIGGPHTDTVEEFFAANYTWSPIGVQPIYKYRGGHSVVAVPASLFDHLPGGCKGVL